MRIASAAAIDAPDMRAADAERLSLALMDGRNHTLDLLARFEDADTAGDGLAADPGRLQRALRIAGHIGWLAEFWIGRNPQWARGRECAADAPRLASIEPRSDPWFDPRLGDGRDGPALEAGSVRAYLLETLETTLDLLEKARDDAALYFFRMALFHEDLRGEQLVMLAQAYGVPLPLALPAPAPAREPVLVPATRWRLGWDEPGFALDIEQGSHEVEVPEFEIDAQPVTWSQYVEFIDDGGYDRQELWAPEGWAWLERAARREGRRGPAHVEQIGVASGAVLQNLFGRAMRMGGGQSAMHVTWWEADAYARWAGRRLPTEVEWEIAASVAARRGFRWGDVREWTAGTLRPWPGFSPDPWAVHAGLDASDAFGVARVQRGASFAARARMRHPKARSWELPDRDDAFVGLRTCAW